MSHDCKRENSWLDNHDCCVCFDETDSLKSFKNENEDKKKVPGPLLSTFKWKNSGNTLGSNCRTATVFTTVFVLLGIGALIVTLIYRHKGKCIKEFGLV